MNIELWMDPVCPFCFLGMRHLELALEKLDLHHVAKVRIRSYELDPDRPFYAGKGLIETLMEKYDLSREETEGNLAEVKKRGLSVGIDFRFDIVKPTNTRNAHRLLQFANSQGKGHELSRGLFQSYFHQGGLLSDHEVLLELATQADLDEKKAKAVLEDPSFYLTEVLKDSARREDLGFDTVPYLLINEHLVIDDSGTPESFIEKLKEA